MLSCQRRSIPLCYECATFKSDGHLPLDSGDARRLDVRLPRLFPCISAQQTEQTKPFEMNTRDEIISGDGSLFHRCGRALKFRWLVLVAILFCICVTGCKTARQPGSDPYSPTFTDFNLVPPSTNVLDESDLISITFRYSTNFDALQKIGLDGMVNLDGVGEVKAAGKTVMELENELTTLYKSQVKDDPITVRIVTAGAAVYVTGAVNHPGKIPMDRPMTVIDAIAEAGGFDQYRAKLSKVSILRVDGNTQKTYWVNVNRALNGEDPNPFFLKPFDVIHVPTRTFNF